MGATDAAFEEERQAIEGRFATAWGATTPVKYENAPFKDTKAAHVALFIRRGEGLQASLGEVPLRRWPGVILVQVFIPSGSGTQQALEYASSIGAIFDRAEFSSGTSGRIRCRIPSVETVGERAGWFQVNVTVPYLRDKAY